MALNWPAKDPDELLDYQINWADALSTDTIVASSWTIGPDPSLLNDHSTFASNTATIWLKAGTLGTTYAVNNLITTAGGRIFDQTVNISIKAK